MSSTRAALHALVDALPDDHIGVAAILLASVPSEPMTADEEHSVRRGLTAADQGDLHPADEVMGRWKGRIEAARNSSR